MKWEILILTMPERAWVLSRLLGILRPQVTTYSDVGILVREHDTNIPLGQNREALRQKSSAEYINFVDDDDLVSEDYVAKIYPLLDGVDVIGFKTAFYRNGVHEPTMRTTISLRYKGWTNDDKGYYCDISHLSPMRRELALQVPMEGGRGEDARWATELRNRRVVLTEHYIPEVMYHYLS